MDFGSILIILALLVLVALFITRPLLENKTKADDRIEVRTDHELSALLAERDQVLNALTELDMDYALGKIPLQDYPIERTALLERGTQILKALDNYQTESGQVPPALGVMMTEGLSEVMQAEPAQTGELLPVGPNGSNHVSSSARNTALPADDDLEILLATRRRVRQEKAAGFCPRCGNAIQKTDQFCPKCGNKLG